MLPGLLATRVFISLLDRGLDHTSKRKNALDLAVELCDRRRETETAFSCSIIRSLTKMVYYIQYDAQASPM
jgi:hypothetical protein